MVKNTGKNVVIVGGGLAGLAASIYLARGGRTVTVFEKRQALGGRAITHLRQGYRLNLGPHAVYRFGAARAVYRELGIPVPGRVAKPKPVALHRGDRSRLPSGILSALTTSLLSVRGKIEFLKAAWRIRRLQPARVASMSTGEWLDANFTDARARAAMAAIIRLATYADPETQSAALALAQTKVAFRGVIYVDEGWQRLVDSLRNTAVTSGVNFVSMSRIVGVVRDHIAVRAVELGGLELDADRTDTMSIAMPEMKPENVEGALIPAETVLLCVDPATAAELAGGADFTKSWTAARPVTASCLDVALRSLPQKKNTFALGIEEPHYFSVHSAFAQLAPKGGAVIHAMKYGGGAKEDEWELESLIDRMQPGWRELVVHRRYLPSMIVSNALVTPDIQRPSPITPVQGLYIAGDWVGNVGLLSDAALASARDAAKAILAT